MKYLINKLESCNFNYQRLIYYTQKRVFHKVQFKNYNIHKNINVKIIKIQTNDKYNLNF